MRWVVVGWLKRVILSNLTTLLIYPTSTTVTGWGLKEGWVRMARLRVWELSCSDLGVIHSSRSFLAIATSWND